VGKPVGGAHVQLLNGWPGIGQRQVLVPAASMPQVTQQSCVHGLPQLTLWQSDAQAPPACESGLSAAQVQLPGCAAQTMPPVAPAVPELPPVPLDVPPPVPVTTPVEPPVPVAVLAEEHAKNTKLCTSRAATPNVLS
jgi:hypothetical protein